MLRSEHTEIPASPRARLAQVESDLTLTNNTVIKYTLARDAIINKTRSASLTTQMLENNSEIRRLTSAANQINTDLLQIERNIKKKTEHKKKKKRVKALIAQKQQLEESKANVMIELAQCKETKAQLVIDMANLNAATIRYNQQLADFKYPDSQDEVAQLLAQSLQAQQNLRMLEQQLREQAVAPAATHLDTSSNEAAIRDSQPDNSNNRIPETDYARALREFRTALSQDQEETRLREVTDYQRPAIHHLYAKGRKLLKDIEDQPNPDQTFSTQLLNAANNVLRDYDSIDYQLQLSELAAQNTNGKPDYTKQIVGGILIFLGAAILAVTVAMAIIPSIGFLFFVPGIFTAAALGLTGAVICESGQRYGMDKNLHDFQSSARKARQSHTVSSRNMGFFQREPENTRPTEDHPAPATIRCTIRM